ncbi:MAG: fluoride efflux transporter CrcB [Alphaproteobacteria bacterium]|nr:fluoride efflux transporter CrcB [Alphaproteobacteria bacterium]
MQAWIAVAAGGMVGAVLRHLVNVVATKLAGHGFPLGTMIVNIAGSFAMGALVAVMALYWSASQEARLFLAVGLLGSFTTFSTFSLDIYTLYERQAYGPLIVYTLGSFCLSLLGLVLGLAVVRRVLAP